MRGKLLLLELRHCQCWRGQHKGIDADPCCAAFDAAACASVALYQLCPRHESHEGVVCGHSSAKSLGSEQPENRSVPRNAILSHWVIPIVPRASMAKMAKALA